MRSPPPSYMSKTDWAALALNSITALVIVLGLASNNEDLIGSGLLLALVAMAVNSALLIRRAERPPVASPQLVRDGLDAHQLLYIDERLEALERAEARTLRTLADEGAVRGPAHEPGAAEHLRTPQSVSAGE